MPRSEKDFQQEFRASVIETLGSPVTFWKYPDLGYSTPYDCHVFKDGLFSAFELKIVKSIDAWNLKDSFRNREFQVDNLMRVNSLGGNAWIVVNHFHGRGHNRAYAMCPEVAKSILYDGASISFSESLEQRLIEELGNKGAGVWDLKKLFKNDRCSTSSQN
jgi:hypothetical protein